MRSTSDDKHLRDVSLGYRSASSSTLAVEAGRSAETIGSSFGRKQSKCGRITTAIDPAGGGSYDP